jgi:hypothetical protein
VKAEKKSFHFRILVDFLRRLFGRKSGPPSDPYAYVMAPRPRGPNGRSSAAVAEIEDDSFRSFPPRH